MTIKITRLKGQKFEVEIGVGRGDQSSGRAKRFTFNSPESAWKAAEEYAYRLAKNTNTAVMVIDPKNQKHTFTPDGKRNGPTIYPAYDFTENRIVRLIDSLVEENKY